MPLNFSKTIIAALSILTALSATATIANSQVRSQINPRIRTNPEVLRLINSTSVSGTITNGGSNNGGQPNFACSDIELYVAQTIPSPPPAPGQISIPQYQKIGESVKAQGNIASGCQYTLPISASATGKPIYLFATAPRQWTTSVDVVNISPAGWNNPIQVARNNQLTNRNLQIRATQIK